MIIDDASSFVEYWRSVRQRTRRLVPLIPPDQLEWSPGAARWSLGDIVRHLAGTERWMWAENVQGHASRYPGHDRELADGLTAVTAYLDRLHEESCSIFGRLTPDQLRGRTVTPAGTALTTYKWLRAMVEHEAHHRGQMHFVLGLLGVPTPQLFGLTEEEVRARSRGA